MPLPSNAAKHHKGNHKGGAMRSADADVPSPQVVAADAVMSASGSSSGAPPGPDLQAMFDKFAMTFDTRLGSLELNISRDIGGLANSLDGAITKMADRMDAHELHSKTQFDDVHAKIKELEVRMATRPAAAAPTSSSSAAGLRMPSFAPAAPSGKPSDDCIVFIRGFPLLLPSFAMKNYVTEALSILSPAERGLVRVRSAQVDDQFSLVFPSALKADAFIESYRTYGFCYIDPADDDKIEVTLKAFKSKPLPMRRRGAAIRPVYVMLEQVLSQMPTLSAATISQRQAPRMGVWATEFYALCGRSLAPLFTLKFREDPDATIITELMIPEGGSPLSSDDLMLLRAAAGLQ
jgi:hypothetical protein